jgi:predicted PurR-regulated permease PerM
MKKPSRPLLQFGLVLWISLCGIVAFYFVLYRFESVASGLNLLKNALMPLLIGLVLAYLMFPVCHCLEILLNHVKGIKKASRPLSIVLTLLLVFAVLFGFSALVLPEISSSVTSLINDLPEQMGNMIDWLSARFETNNELESSLISMLESAQSNLTSWLKTNLFSTIMALSDALLSVGSFFMNLILAIMVAIYLLLDYKRYIAQVKKLFVAISPDEHFNQAVFESVEKTHQIFNGFITGKLLDSLIVFLICFACMSLFKMPYALLVSLIVGITNIIPMFGPFIGAIPSALLILLVSWQQCVLFLIFIVVLQQIDGNIIGPKILGNSTGLSSLYVVVAMLLFGRLFGFIGMIVGVPVTATLYYLISRIANAALRKRGLSTKTSQYMNKDYPVEY